MADPLVLPTFVLVLVAAALAWAWGRSATALRRSREIVVGQRHELAEREAEARLAREGEEQARQVVNTLPMPVAFVDSGRRIRYVNQRLQEWLGLSADQLIGHDPVALPWPLASDRLAEGLAAASNGRADSFEASLTLRSAPQPVAISISPDGAGGQGAAIIVIEDLSERRHVEEELRGSEATTRAILEAAVDGIITIDSGGGIETFNRAAERIFGYTAAEVMGKNVNMLMPSPYREAHDDYLANYQKTGTAKIIGIGREVVGRRKDGSTFPMDLAVGESRVGGRRIFAGIVRDITERKQTLDRLAESEERFRLLVEGVRDYSIIILDTGGRIASWNLGAERITGWRAEEVIGQHLSLFYPVDEVVAGRPEQALEAVNLTGRYEEEGWRLRKSGAPFWSHVAITPLTDDTGAVRGYVRISRDMTSHKQAEEALRRAKEEAERANLGKSKFLAAASHDLRQPVQALFFFTAALARRLHGHPARDVLADLERSLESLNMLMDSLLDISKLDAGVVTPKETTFSVASLLDRMEGDFGSAARAKGLRLRVMPSTAVIRSDPSLLSRVVQNLVANAVRYTGHGRILVGCRRHGDALRIEVWDTGIGIPNDRLGDIFEEFYQVGNPERDRSQGLGLGLAIVNRLARLLHHHVSVRSVLGHGSVFTVEVPLGEQPVAVSAARRAVAAQAGNSRCVLIIDDETTVLKGLRLILEEWGFDVLAATSEDEAISILENQHRQPNAIVADYRLRNGKTGTEAIRHIRDLFSAPIPSIIITGDTAPERLREAEASGLSILHKPVQPPELHTLLNETMGHA